MRPHIKALNVENPEQRFPRRGDDPGPDIATWRCNLAALSQRRNLLFVAHGCDIYVWIPKGSRQLLGAQPEMIIHPVMKQPGAAGYIDPSAPHTINHIIVDDLGVDEVLLLATDSGNVTGYNVEAIFSELSQCAELGQKKPFDGIGVKPFFAEYVLKSAWGLATHKFARLIAVSSNTGNITVFAFAMVDLASEHADSDVDSTQNMESGDPTGEEQTWVKVNRLDHLNEIKQQMPNHRKRNLRLSYKGHFENIPCVSFANFDLDPNGLWMVSTDIFNRVVVWRIWDNLNPIQMTYLGNPHNNPPQRGWFVLPIDPRRVQRHKLKIDACGCQPIPKLMRNRMILNVTTAMDQASEISTAVALRLSKSSMTHKPLPDDIFSSDCCVGPGSPSQHSGPQQDPLQDIGHTKNKLDNAAPHTWFSATSAITDLIEEDNKSSDVHSFELLVPPVLEENDLSTLGRIAVHPSKPRFFPILHFSERDICLAPYPLDTEFQTLCKGPLWQRSYMNEEINGACDRFNMVKYIPELGIVAAASQKGRVAIITITWQEEIGTSFRLDWIVPSFTQEMADERPIVPLLGIAVSPMPGFDIPPDVPCIPRDVDPDEWLEFNYRILNPDNDDQSDKEPHSDEEASFTGSTPAGQDDPMQQRGSKTIRHARNTPYGLKNLTLPEIHAHASDVYYPYETWHGSHPSRHYRLLLMYCNHTVMSYEFWHHWRK
ncbi:uncharacterized protein N7511_006100 [Penicillium nucicola]|uniref:uncharacterized protein n=1 Tax=Penicillium nucicola TaxID=1850975 RepID=UPI0025452A2C|nr:uncharacterized protein N7511_006100 [Penicillium nucicola]KAJ5757406.1 hypothetical protein N7511_006100 [Penicillium nucicola]